MSAKELQTKYLAIQKRGKYVLTIVNDLQFAAQRKQVMQMCEDWVRESGDLRVYTWHPIKKMIDRSTEEQKGLEGRFKAGLEYLINNRDKYSEKDWLKGVRRLIKIWDRMELEIPTWPELRGEI